MTAIGSRRWSARTGNCARPTRSCARRRRILPRRSSIARSNDDRLHRRSSWGIWGRADLPRAADRPSHLPHARCPARRPGQAASAIPARPGAGRRDPAGVRGKLPRLRRAQGVAATRPRGHSRRTLHCGPADAADGPERCSARPRGPYHGQQTTVACPLDRVNRQFRTPRPNVLWLSDFTYVATWQGFVYVAFVIDAYARRIVGWRVRRTAQAGFVLDALEQALADRRPVRGGGLVHHSDRGVQYVSIRYTERLAEAGIEPSVGSVGDSYENALAESINGLYKTEVIRRRGPWRSLELVEFATLEWVEWFNNRRLLGPIGNVPPAEAEVHYYAELETLPMAA